MRGHLDRLPIRRRVSGRAVLVRSLRQLAIRVRRLGEARSSPADQAWARKLGDALALALAIADPSAVGPKGPLGGYDDAPGAP